MSERPTLWEVSDLVLEAGLDPRLWAQVPGAFAALWPGTKVVLHAQDNRSRRSLGMLIHGFDPKVSADYREHYAFHNPWVPLIQAAPVGVGLCADEALPSRCFTHLEFYDWIRREGEVESAAGIKLYHDEARHAVVNLHYGAAVAERYNGAIPRGLQRLAGSLRAALELNRALAAESLADNSLTGVLAALAAPALLLDCRGRLREANAAGLAELAQARVLRCDRDQLVVPVASGRAADFATALRRAGRAPREGGAGDELVLPLLGSGRPVLATVAPLASPPARSQAAWLFGTERLALVVLRGLAAERRLDPQRLRRLFGFTATEARLAARLGAGASLTEAAAALKISRNTARQHLKAVFLKTDTHRQLDLVQLLGHFADGATADEAALPG